MKVKVQLYRPYKARYYILYDNILHEFNNARITFTFYCDLVPWVFKMYNIEPGDNPDLLFDSYSLYKVNNVTCIYSKIKLNDLFPNGIKVHTLNDDVSHPTYSNGHKFNYKNIIFYKGSERLFWLKGDFKYIHEEHIHLHIPVRIDIEYHTYDKKKQCNLKMMVYADKKDCLGDQFG